MAAVGLMLLLPDELLTKIIIHYIKDVVVFHFLNLRNKICGTFRCICNSDEVLLHVPLHDLREACKIATSGRTLSGASARPIIQRHCASRDGEVDEAAQPR
jgi:hypothetical protein